MTMGIYCIRNKITGERYIGSAVDIYLRWMQHEKALNRKCHHSGKLQLAWKKYDSRNFEFTIIEEISVCDNKILCEREQYWMDYYDSYKKGYNSTPIAARPRTLTDEERSHRDALIHIDKMIGKYEPQYAKKIREQNPLQYNLDEQRQWEINFELLKKQRKPYYLAGAAFFLLSLVACVAFKLQIAFCAFIPIVIVTFIICTWKSPDWDELKRAEPKIIAQQAQNKLVEEERNKRRHPYRRGY